MMKSVDGFIESFPSHFLPGFEKGIESRTETCLKFQEGKKLSAFFKATRIFLTERVPSWEI